MKHLFRSGLWFIWGLILLCGSVNSFSQTNLIDIDRQIASIDSQAQYISLVDSYRENDTLSLYLSRTRLAINRAVQERFNFLTGIKPGSPDSPLTIDDYTKRLLELYIHANAKTYSYLEEYNQVVKYAERSSSEKITNSLSTLTNRQIRLSHHQLSLAYVENNRFTDQPAIRAVFFSEFQVVEQELQRRGFFPSAPVDQHNIGELMSRRTVLIENINRYARQEAVQFVDSRSSSLESRKFAQSALEEIHEIDLSLGVAKEKTPLMRDFFTDFTIEQRIRTFVLGDQQLEKRIALKRDHAAEEKVLRSDIQIVLKAERIWFTKSRIQEVILRGMPLSRPPPESLLDLSPFPKNSSNVMGMDEFLDYRRIDNTNRNSQQVYEKAIIRQAERLKALNIESSEIIDLGIRNSNSRKPPIINNFSSYMTSLQHEYHKLLVTDPVKAELVRVEFEQAIKYFSNGNDVPLRITSFLENNPATLSQYSNDLTIVRNAIEKKIVQRGDFAPLPLKMQMEQLNAAISELESAMIRAKQNIANTPLERLAKSGDIQSRPPPDVEAWVNKHDARLDRLNHENFVSSVINEHQIALKKKWARYGSDVPTSVIQKFAANQEVLTGNKVARVVYNYNALTSNSNFVQFFESLLKSTDLSPEGAKFVNNPDNIRNYDDIKLKQLSLDEEISRLTKELYSERIRGGIPERLFRNYQEVREAISGNSSSRRNINIEHESHIGRNQDFEKMKSMRLSDKVGGVFLTPIGDIIPPVVLPSTVWKLIEENENECNSDGGIMTYTEWKLNEAGTRKVCFPVESEEQFNPYTHENQLELWF